MSAKNGKAKSRKAGGPGLARVTAAGGCDHEAATVARGLEEAAGELVISIESGMAAGLGKLALITLVDVRRRLARLARRIEAQP